MVPLGPEDDARTILGQLERLVPGKEVIVSATRPATAEEQAAGVGLALTWLVGTPGRGGQLNRGAERAIKPWLWFVHADTVVSAQAVSAARRFAEAGSATTIGFFRLAFQDDGPPLMWLNAAGANWRSRWLGLPFGDQGYLMPRSLWQTLGGFDLALGLGEDLDLVVRARRSGVRLVQLPATLVTSARRYRASGWLATTGRYLWLTGKLYLEARRRLRQG